MMIDWVEIPAGKFRMGLSSKQATELLGVKSVDEETRQREIALPGYYIARFPITCSQFTQFAQEIHPGWNLRMTGDPAVSKHPVFTALDIAEEFCRWIGARLPTSEEWEKAARGTDGRIFPWGNQWDPDRGNFGQWERRGRTGGVKTVPVDSYPEGASPYGVMDMIGNCYEWTMTPHRIDRMWVIRGSDTDSSAITPRAHRITALMIGGRTAMSYPPNTGFRPVLDHIGP
jgi:formylglycine-generating enzyme required for sulfatase activity